MEPSHTQGSGQQWTVPMLPQLVDMIIMPLRLVAGHSKPGHCLRAGSGVGLTPLEHLYLEGRIQPKHWRQQTTPGPAEHSPPEGDRAAIRRKGSGDAWLAASPPRTAPPSTPPLSTPVP